MGWDFSLSLKQSDQRPSFDAVLAVLKDHETEFEIRDFAASVDIRLLGDEGPWAEDCTLHLESDRTVRELFVYRAHGSGWDELIFELMDKFCFRYYDGGVVQYVHGPDGFRRTGRLGWEMKIYRANQIGRTSPSDFIDGSIADGDA